jgi:hypothetical protein
MHNCKKIEERLIDLVFDELNEDDRKRTLAEVESCEHCRAEYQSFATTLSVVDQASAALMPDEQYWNGYEARLRTKLASDERPSLWQRLFAGLSTSMTRPVWAVSVALLLCFALLLWLMLAKTTNTVTPPQLANDNPAPVKPDDQNKEKENQGVEASTEDKDKQLEVPLQPNPQRKKDSLLQTGRILAVRKNNQLAQPENVVKAIPTPPLTIAANFEPSAASASFVDNETLKHFEKAQLFLRAFRNLDSADSASVTEIADDKQRSRALLFKNVLLRREAETKGNLPVEQVLSDLEPLLIDIANLPDKATPDDIRTIHERVQKREMIATLQVYAARPLIAKAVSD